MTLRWSNAGHPAPVLVCAEGTAVLLGVSPDAPRHDHTVALHPGDTVLFHTDGLVEQRNLPLDEGTAWLVGELRRIGDDVALLAVRLPSH